MTGDLLDRLERELVDGMRRYEAHGRRRRRLQVRAWTPAIAAAALTVTALLALALLWPTPHEMPRPNAGPPPPAPPPPHIANRNWKPVIPDPAVFQLLLSATSWTAVPGHQNEGKHGRLRWSGQRMIVDADPPCPSTGVYRVDLVQKNRLTITAEHDRCIQRRDLLQRTWFGLP